MRRAAPGAALALALALALASCACAGAHAGPAATLLAESGPLRPLRRLQKAGLKKAKCPAERIGCANCWQFEGEDPVTCGGCKRGYVYNFESDACDCAINYGQSCSDKTGDCVCKKCGRVEGVMTSSPGGPLDEAECTDNGLEGSPRSVGAAVDLDRACNDGPPEVVATALADVVGGADGVVPDSPVVFFTKCANKLAKSTGVTTGRYSFRVEYLAEKTGGGGGGNAARAARAARAAGGNATKIAMYPAMRSARRAARDRRLRFRGRSRAALRLAAAYASVDGAAAVKTKDVLSLIKDGGLCDELTNFFDFDCAVKASGGAPSAPMNPGVPDGWAVAVPARGVADAGRCPSGAALDAAVQELGAALAAAVKAMPGVTTVKAPAFIRCDVVGSNTADGPVVEFWFNVIETHSWKSSPVTNVAAAAAAAAGVAGDSAGICADNALPMLCKLDGRVLGRLGYAYQDALRCARGAARRADPTATEKVDVFTYAYDIPDSSATPAGADDFFDPRPFVPLALAQRGGGAGAAFDPSAPAVDRDTGLGGALKLMAAGVKGSYKGDSVKLIGTMMDGPVGTQFKDQTCPGYAEATAAAASQAWGLGYLSEVQSIELIASTPDDLATAVTNTTSNTTTDEAYEFLEVSLYVTNKNRSEPVTYADVVELVYQPGPHQQDPYAPDLNLIESSWFQRRRDQTGSRIVEMNQVPRLSDGSITSYPTIDRYRTGRAYLARVPNAAGTASYTLRSARFGNNTRVLALGVGIASARPADPTEAEDPFTPGVADPLPAYNEQPRTFYVSSLKIRMSKGPVDPEGEDDVVEWDHTIQFVSLL